MSLRPPFSAPQSAPPARSAPALVAVAHGSRDPRALPAITALLELVRSLRPGLRVVPGHIELNEPLLPDTLDALPAGPAVLVPLLFGRGHHVKHDIPRAAAAAAHLEIRTAAPLGPHPLLAEALAARLAEAVPAGGAPDGVVLAAAGSRDPESARDAGRTAALLSARLGGVPVLPAYASAAAPTVPEAVAALRRAGCRRPALASYFAAPGHFAARCARAVPELPAAGPLGAHPALARLVLHRYDEARARLRAPVRRPRAGRPVPVPAGGPAR
ncbi:CbiX/SirB N-terminal domain-containing protein [Streptomyces sp. TRM 70361]|uniref:sirohydrochlorin chelatase n=1 Tax=Streptomyces sp. TRM 70361 TaxID=3116553 RepID=UPI002E7B4795|nr:CbiX/SirB N-terminal domain-containing protein [Streptomyces sp. TRM 70361]MEE1938241.1 CbiX/SirB N-terminal domain-containing protein [Streptomyces sp. TRM 70361]